jgi:hypothetical protein
MLTVKPPDRGVIARVVSDKKPFAARRRKPCQKLGKRAAFYLRPASAACAV